MIIPFGFLKTQIPVAVSGTMPVIESFTTRATIGSAPNNIVMTKPTGVEVGDLLIIMGGNEDNTDSATFPTYTGWTKLFEYGGSVSSTKLMAYWRIADGTEGATESIFFNTGTDYAVAWYLRVSGADATTPISLGTGSGASTSAQSSVTATSVTTTDDNSLAIAMCSVDGADGTFGAVTGTGWDTSIPVGQQAESGSVAGDTSGYETGFITKEITTAGASENVTFNNSISDGFIAIQLIINPI